MKKLLSLSLVFCILLLLCACSAQQVAAPTQTENESPAADPGSVPDPEPAAEEPVVSDEPIPDTDQSDEVPADSDVPVSDIPSPSDDTPADSDVPASGSSASSEEPTAEPSFEALLLDGTWAEINPRLGTTREYTFQADRTVLLETYSGLGTQSLSYSLDTDAMSVTVEEAEQTIVWRYNAEDGYLYGAAEERPHLNYETYLVHNYVPSSAQAASLRSSFRAYYLAHHTCDLENKPSDFLTMLQSGAWYLFGPQDLSAEVFTFLPDNTVQVGWRWTYPGQDVDEFESSVYVLPYQVDAEKKTVTMFQSYDETYGTMLWTYQEDTDRFTYTFWEYPYILTTVYVPHYPEAPTVETLHVDRDIWYEDYMQNKIYYPEKDEHRSISNP